MKSTKFLLALGLLVVMATSVNAQKMATANDRDGVVLFVECVPAIQYRHQGTVSCATFSPDEIDPLIDHMIKQTRKDHEEFDALIFRSGSGLCKADAIQFYKDPKASKRRGRANEEPEVDPKYKQAKAGQKKGAGTMVFLQSSPVDEYQLLGKVESPVTFRSKDIEDLINELVRVSKAAYPDMDAIVVVDGSNIRKANVIKFK